MGLIYVNPKGPDSKNDPLLAAFNIWKTFSRMAMNDEKTVALIAGVLTFGKAHSADPADHFSADPEAADLDAQGLGWHSSFCGGKAGDAIISGLKVTWTSKPAHCSNDFFKLLFSHEWALTKSPFVAEQQGVDFEQGPDDLKTFFRRRCHPAHRHG